MAITRGITPGQPGNIPVAMRFEHGLQSWGHGKNYNIPFICTNCFSAVHISFYMYYNQATWCLYIYVYEIWNSPSHHWPFKTSLSEHGIGPLAPKVWEYLSHFLSPIHGVTIDIDLPWGLTAWDDCLSYIDRSRSFFFIHRPGVTVAILSCYVFAP